MSVEIERIAALIQERKAAFHAEHPNCPHYIMATFEVPRIDPAKPGADMPFISMDLVDDEGRIVYNRMLTFPEAMMYREPENIAEAFNLRAGFERWLWLRQWREICIHRGWHPYTPGVWRGEPNPHAIK